MADGPETTAPATRTVTPKATRGRVAGILGCAAAVVVCEALVFRYLFQYGVSNIWYADGASQHFPALLYFHEWVTALLSGHGGAFGMWSWRLGFGADTMTTLSYYLADPFAWISLLFPAHLLEYVYQGLFFLRVLCAGLAAFLYLRTMKATRFAAVAGSLVYVFATFLMQVGLKHPYFVDAMVWFPLILLGTEMVLVRRRWYLLAGALAIAAASNFYFFYQIGLVAIIYAVARWFEITPRGKRLRSLVSDGLRVAGWYALGTLLAAIVLAPVALAVLASSRGAATDVARILFPLKTYGAEIVALVSPIAGNNEALLMGGFAIFGVMAAAVVFMRRGNFALKVMLAAFVVFAAAPVFADLLNAGSSASYRFYFMAGLFLAAAVASVLSDPKPLSRRELTSLAIGLFAFSAVYLYAARHAPYPLWLVSAPVVIGVLSLGLLFAEQRLCSGAGAQHGERSWWNPWLRVGIVVLIAVGIAAGAEVSYSKRYDPILSTYVLSGTAFAMYHDDPGSLVGTLPVEDGQRIDKQQGVLLSDLEVSQNNDPLAQDYAGLDFYFSLMNNGVHEYLKGLADRSQRFAYDFEGLDDRAALDTLAGVRYYVAPSGGEAYVPYGFTRSSTLGTATVYENSHALPVGYVYHSVVASATYGAMSPLDKQQALLQGVVLADGQAPRLLRIAPAPEAVEVTYTLTPGSGMTWDQTARRISVSKQGTGADLQFAPVPDAELYVEMTGVRFPGDDRLLVAVEAGGPRKVHRFLPASSAYNWGDDRLVVNLGYLASGTSHARISFLDRRVVRYSSLKVFAMPMARYADHVNALAAEGMRGVTVGADALSGTVTSHGDGVLFLSVPYDAGWSAAVDGIAAPIMKANVGFSGIAVGDGTHRVEMRYATPGLRVGILVSVLALLLTIALAILTERRLAAHRRARQTTAGAEGD